MNTPIAHVITLESGQLAWADAIDEAMAKIINLKESIKLCNENIKDELADDPDYTNADTIIKEQQKIRRVAKANLNIRRRDLITKLEEYKEELKETQQSLEAHLIAYRENNSTHEFVSPSTHVAYEIQVKPKLIKK